MRHWITTPSGLQFYDYRLSDGAPAQIGQLITVHYVMAKYSEGLREDLRSDNEAWLDNSWIREAPISFRLGAGEVLKGIDEGLVQMRIAAYRHLRIPPHLAFGEKGVPNLIPPNTELYCEVYLVSITD